jgi:hypothetical protein
LLRPVELTSPGALGYLRPLVFGNGTLHVEKELALRSGLHRSFQEIDGHTLLLELFHQDDELGTAGQPVWRLDLQRVNATFRC